MRIGILLFDGVDLLDAGGPYEVFLTASRLAVRGGEPPPFEVVTVSPSGATVEAYGGIRLTPHCGADDVDALDVLVVPGAIDLEAITADRDVLAAVRGLSATSTVTASVCTGAFLLGEIGLLADRSWTTHWEDVAVLAQRVGESGATRDVRWVDAGAVVTSAGLSSGIAMALHLVGRLVGGELAERTARQIEYEWRPEGGR